MAVFAKEQPFGALFDTELPRLRPIPLSESEKRREACESTEARDERSSVEELLVGPPLVWLRFKVLLLPIRRSSPCDCGPTAELGEGVQVPSCEDCRELPVAVLLAEELLPPPPRRFRMLLLLPKNLRRLKPLLEPAAEDESG